MKFATFRIVAPLGISIACAVLMAVPAEADTVNHCARLGADYVAVAGSNGCVKIGGHVRVDIARAPASAMGYAALPDGVQRAAARSGYYPPVAPFGLTDLFPR